MIYFAGSKIYTCIKQVLILFILITSVFAVKAQTGTFIALDAKGDLYRVNISGSGCSSTLLNICSNPSNSLLSIALDGTTIYLVDNKGVLYKNTLGTTGTTGTCTKVGTFASGNGIYGLTVGPTGIVYAANGNEIETYIPTSGVFKSLGFVNAKYSIGGDLLFYNSKLYEAVYVNGNQSDNRLLELNTTSIVGTTISSTEYLTFAAGVKVFGFASTTVPCNSNQAYALSSGTTTTNIYAVDMVGKTQSSSVFCTLPFNVYDAASVAETQSATAPTAPTVTSPYNFCLNSPVSPTAIYPTPSTGDTLRWYIALSGGIPKGSPQPAVSSSSISSNAYYVSQYDITTGCESPRSTIAVNIVGLPTISIPNTAQNVCQNASAAPITSNATAGSGSISGYQWYSNTASSNSGGTIIISATLASYTPSTNNAVTRYYYCIVTNSNGCSASSNVSGAIDVKAPTSSSVSVVVCPSALPYNWNGIAYNAAGTYTKTLTNAVGCDSVATLILTVKATSASSTLVSVCPSALPYNWNGIAYNAAGTYTKTLTNAVGCDSVATLILTVETFKLSLSANPNPVNSGAAFFAQITANLPIITSTWQPNNLFVNNQSTQTINAPDTSFILVVTGTSVNGCKDVVTGIITVVPSSNTFFIPNALTPAAFGTDASVIKVYGTTVKAAQLLMYNQWGQLIFTTDNATTKGWDGTFNGKAQPSGIYNYVVRVIFQNNKVETKAGSINLVR